VDGKKTIKEDKNIEHTGAVEALRKLRYISGFYIFLPSALWLLAL
jgi:hypothetical protein